MIFLEKPSDWIIRHRSHKIMKLKDVYKKILDNLNQPILLIDRKYIIIDVNRSASIHFNLPVKKIIGQSCYKITHKCDKPCWQISDNSCPAKNAFKKKERSHVIHKHLSKNKVNVEEIVTTPLYNGKYVIEEFRDITNLLGLVDGILPICASCKRIRDEEGNFDPDRYPRIARYHGGLGGR